MKIIVETGPVGDHEPEVWETGEELFNIDINHRGTVTVDIHHVIHTAFSVEDWTEVRTENNDEYITDIRIVNETIL